MTDGSARESFFGYLEDQFVGIIFGAILGTLATICSARICSARIAPAPAKIIYATPSEREFCDSQTCIYATPDGLRVENYTDQGLHCEPLPTVGKGGVRASTPEIIYSWWAIGREGPFMKCSPR